MRPQQMRPINPITMRVWSAVFNGIVVVAFFLTDAPG